MSNAKPWHQHEDADAVPSTDSEDQQERLKARRMRIAAREDSKRRQALGEDPNSRKDVKEDLRQSHKQVEDSRQRLSKLVSDGTQLVTDIQAAADAREAQRRAEEEELKRLRLDKLENEAKTSLETFEDITNKWVSAKNRKIPQDIWEVLNMQQQQCAHLIGEKNHLIGELQQELKGKDDQYVKDLKKQAADIDLLIERMEEQIRNLTKTYREELLQAEKSFEMERRELLSTNRNRWEKGMQSRRDQELEYLLSRMRKVEENEEQLRHLRVQDAEEYNIIKNKLETDVQILEQQLQQMKATYQLNQEKLEYNFQVLKKRDEENTITKSQQKRKITRMQDVLNKLRIKLEKQIKQHREENQSLTDDYRRIVEQYKQLQKKMRHFAAVDSKKFHEIWLMNEEEVKELVTKALEADRVIYEQQLGLPWAPPDLWFMENVGPLSLQKAKKRTATQLAEEVMLGEGKQTYNEEDAESVEKVDVSAKDTARRMGQLQFSSQTVKRILEILSDESGFLIESKLRKLLAPLQKDEGSLMKLEAVFVALGIDSEGDVYNLVDFFLKYQAEHQSPDQNGENGSKIGQGTKLRQSSTSELIHPNVVLKALREFVMAHRMASDKRSKLGPIEARDSSGDAGFWDAMAHVIPDTRLKEWEALEAAILKYHNVLMARSQLVNETDGLAQQNSELRILLHQYLNSKVSSELQVPPTHVLQMDPRQTS
ncbi:dynein regulatory complex protein 1-like [Ambystoma mexicanum]|uniref:dynein regulatory complex protein 1-like n=1 Tax=Ambystoma mexicanum TaxID=8296 RepID=UPI0037E8514A